MEMKLFTAEWCGPCKMLKQWLAEKDLIDKVTIIDIDSEEGSEQAAKDGIRGIPALKTDNQLLTTNENIRPYLTGAFL